MKKMKRFSAILLALAMCLALAACGGNNTEETSSAPPSSDAPPPASDTPAPATSSTPAQSGTGEVGEGTVGSGEVIEAPEEARFAEKIDILTEVNIVIVDPYALGGTSSANRVTYQMVYDRLTYFSQEDGLVPELATSWETDDVQTYIFHLRDDVYFHNGDKFTAQDVVDSCELSRETPGTLAYDQWRDIEEISVIDEYTVKMVLEAPNSSFVYNMSLPGGAIINKAAREADPIAGAWVGTGAFYVSDFESSNYTELTRNDNYWGEVPVTKIVNLRYIPEIASRTVMQVNGETDVNLSIGPSDMVVFEDDPNYIIYTYAANTTVSLTFGMLDPLTSNLDFRMAVAHALYRPDIAFVTTGKYAKATLDGAFWGDSTPYRNTDIPQIPFDQDKAREYLVAAGYNGEEVQLICGPDTLAIGGQIIQEQLREVGINIELFSTDVATLVSMTTYGSENIQLIHFVSPFELDPSSARVNLYPGMSANRASYDNPEVNDLIDRARAEVDETVKEALYKEIQLLVSYDIPQLSLYERIWTIVTNNRVGGIITNPDMNHDLRGIFMTVN